MVGASSPLTVQTHPLARLELAPEGDWILSRDDRLSGHRVSAVAAATMVAGFGVTSRTELVREMSGLTCSPVAIEAIVDWLLSKEYLVNPDGRDAVATSEWLDMWNSNGWRAAARYHARTFGYPFEFYDTSGNSAEDVRRMNMYNAEQPDRERAKERITGAEVSYEVPNPAEELNEVRSSAVVVRHATVKEFDRHNLVNLVSLVACPVGTAGMPYPEAEPALRKTSPSGGGRHPTEFYVVTSGVAGMDDALYQVATVAGSLDSIDTVQVAPDEWLKLLNPSLDNAGDGWALIVYSSVFERNRYRYREPRTFRTVHMDVGHLMTTCEFVGRANGWRVEQYQHVDGSALAAILRLDRYVECPMAATFLTVGTRTRE